MRRLSLLALFALPAPALANGAFPDTAQVLLPADRPQTIVLGTNFGLVITEDGGAHWRWSCEHGPATGGYRYTFTPDQRRIVGLAGRALVASEDLGCTWTATAIEDDVIPFDFFPDRNDPTLVLRLSETLRTRVDAISRVDLDEPRATPQVLFEAPADEQLTTIESARSDPRLVYATLNPYLSGGHTRMVRSRDGGQTWTVEPIAAPADAVDLRIAAVDPRAPATLYFRAGTPTGQGESLVVSDDGGATARAAFTTKGALAALLPVGDGAVLFSVIELGVGRVYRFEAGVVAEVPAHISPRGFAERAGEIYAATDNLTDGFALARSPDGGRTWARVMGFDDITGISRCGDLPGVCAATCSMLGMTGAVKPALCAAPAVAPVHEAVDAGAVDLGVDAAADAIGTDAAVLPSSGGCSCGVDPFTSTSTFPFTTLVLLIGVLRRLAARDPS